MGVRMQRALRRWTARQVEPLAADFERGARCDCGMGSCPYAPYPDDAALFSGAAIRIAAGGFR